MVCCSRLYVHVFVVRKGPPRLMKNKKMLMVIVGADGMASLISKFLQATWSNCR